MRIKFQDNMAKSGDQVIATYDRSHSVQVTNDGINIVKKSDAINTPSNMPAQLREFNKRNAERNARKK